MYRIASIVGSIALLGAVVFVLASRTDFAPKLPDTGTSTAFFYTFNSSGTLYEAESMNESSSPYFWINSGAGLVIQNGFGATREGELPIADRFRTLYARMNPVDTDNGYHPQNTFRLVTKKTWDDVRLQAQFKITKDNLSASMNRNASNGLLFMSRYVDGTTLYYAGIRVDGTAIIKKKYKGIYYTMAQKKIFNGTYDRTRSPNLLPHNEWLTLRSETVTNEDGSVSVRLLMLGSSGTWKTLLEAKDDGVQFAGTPIILGPQFAGIRTDFMDVRFDNFRAEEL